MKKFILLLLFFVSLNSNAQCELSFITLFNSLTLNSSDFETYYLSKGFEYYSEKNMFVCFNSENASISNTIQRTISETLDLNYSTTSKESYLKMKEEITKSKCKYLGSKNDNDLTSYFYGYDKVMVTFSSMNISEEKNILFQLK